MSNNKDFKVKNGIKPAAYQEAVGTATSGSTTVGYDLSVAAYDSVSFNSQPSASGPRGLFLKSDGTKMYICTYNGYFYQYSFSTNWDLSTLSYDSVSFNGSAQDSSGLEGFFIKPDGTKMYTISNTNNTAYQYSLSTAWNISTASYDSVSFSVNSQITDPKCIFFKSDGTKMYVSGNSPMAVKEYSLSTAWDISTASSSSSFTIAASGYDIEGLTFESDGTKFYIVDKDNDRVGQYSMTTAWDVSTASDDGITFSVAISVYSEPCGIQFGNNGTKMYIIDKGVAPNYSDVYQYSTGYTLATATLDQSTGSVFDVTPTANTKVSLSNPAASGTVSSSTLLLDGANVSFYDLSVAADTGNTLSTGGELVQIVWGNSGTSLYSPDYAGSTIRQYNFATAYDLSSVIGGASNFSVKTSLAGAGVKGVQFKTDGTKMYIASNSSNKVFQYDLSTAWDITSAAYNSVSYSLASGTWWSILFYNNGYNFVVHRNDTGSYYVYVMSTAWDLSTASDVNSITFAGVTPRSMAFNGDGTKFFMGNGTTDMREFNLPTAYDITSSSNTSSATYALGTDENTFTFNSDGSKFYSGGNVKEFTTATAATTTWDSSIKWSGGTAPDSPAASETDVYYFSTRDGGTSYIANIAIDGAK